MFVSGHQRENSILPFSKSETLILSTKLIFAIFDILYLMIKNYFKMFLLIFCLQNCSKLFHNFIIHLFTSF